MSKITRYYATLKNTTPIAIIEENRSIFEFLNKVDDITISGTAISGIFRDYLIKRYRFVQLENLEVEIQRLEEIYALLFKEIEGLNFKDKETSNMSVQSQMLFLGLIAETTKNYQPLSFFDMILCNSNDHNNDLFEHRNRVMIDRKRSVAVDGGLFKERLIKTGKKFDFAIEFKHLSKKSFSNLSDDLIKLKLNDKRFLKRYLGEDNNNGLDDKVYNTRVNLYEYEIIKKYNNFSADFNIINEFLKVYIDDFINAVCIGEIHLTGKSNLGYGQFKTEKWQWKEFDLVVNLEDYLKLDSVYDNNGFNDRKLESDSNNLEYINVKCDDGLIIAPDNYKKIIKDDKEYEIAIIPSSTIKGIFRSNFERIASTKQKISEDMIYNGYSHINLSNDIENINKIFGFTNEYFIKQDLRKKEDEELLSKKGIVRFYDVNISDFDTVDTTSVKIDRFTGGAYTGSVKDFTRLVLKKDYIIQIKYFIDPYADPLLKECFYEYLDYFLMDIRDGLVSIGSYESTGYGMLTLA